ncbi:MAG: hypothetical protein ACRDJI_04965 [Actinomycetota bacterium]
MKMGKRIRLGTLWLAFVAIVLILAACGGGDGDDEDSALPGGDDAIEGEAPAQDGDESFGEGTVTVDGTEYSFGVFSCVEVNDIPNLGGEGDANITMQGDNLLVQLSSTNQTFTVTKFQYSVDGETVTGTGTGSELGAAGPSVDVELTATCSEF